MKVITILQPFATLIAIKEKRFETRSWKTDYRGPLLIHAGKGTQYMYLCEQKSFKDILKKHGYNKDNLPLGNIIAKVNLKDCIKVVYEDSMDAQLEDDFTIGDKEYIFGDYTPGRYAWKLEDVEMFKEPIPVKGQQRLWNYRGEIIG